MNTISEKNLIIFGILIIIAMIGSFIIALIKNKEKKTEEIQVNDNVKILNNHQIWFENKQNYAHGRLVKDTIKFIKCLQLNDTIANNEKIALEKLIHKNLQIIENNMPN